MCLLKWYKAPKRQTSLTSIASSRWRSVANMKPEISSLPPTEIAAKQHSRQTYCQVQQWLENELPPSPRMVVEKCKRHPSANYNGRST
ncbi:unnamed protein product [Macrosiphum euphorbiae]|uniref:Uncharacterized protein n=1 Tax=Macrosiphum euphorbiae TaxID=13131 RepID=A0AAV0WXI5_9HEMI|nr:unnamed protein product [Macrosiphum euphorbiae]